MFGEKESKEDTAQPNDEDVETVVEKKKNKESVASNKNSEVNQAPEISSAEIEKPVEAEKTDENQESYNSKDPEWGRYYGKTPELELEDKYSSVDKKDPVPGSGIEEAKIEEPFMFPIDILLWSHGGDGYNPMINTGVKVSFMNMYSVVSVGTDFSDSLYRPLSLGLSAGGFYRLSDFSISADLGYEVIWDFGNNRSINDYALGLRAGLSYSIWSWFAVSAGAGVNYSVFKDSNFEDGRFIPMIFGGFEFNLIK
jgi:hypothetical protein